MFAGSGPFSSPPVYVTTEVALQKEEGDKVTLIPGLELANNPYSLVT